MKNLVYIISLGLIFFCFYCANLASNGKLSSMTLTQKFKCPFLSFESSFSIEKEDEKKEKNSIYDKRVPF